MSGCWQNVRLEELAKIQGGGTPRRSEATYFGGSLPWVTPSDLPPAGKTSLLGEVAETLTKAGLENSSAKLINAGSVLFSSRASIGKIAVTDRECATNQGFINLTPDPSKISPWFLAYLLECYTKDLIELAGKTTFLEIPRRKFKEFEVAVPSLGEQQRIVLRINEEMDRVNEIERLREESRLNQVHLSSSLIESELQRAKLDANQLPVCTIGDLVVKVQNGKSIAEDTEGRANGSVLTLTSVRTIDLDFGSQKSIVLPEDIAKKFSISKGDVFVSRANTIELVGLSAVADTEPDERLIYPDLLIRLRADHSRVMPRYLAYALRSAGARKQIKDRALGSSQTMVKISGARLKEVTIPLPSLSDQADIVDRLDQGHRLIRQLAHETLPGEIEALRTSVLRKSLSKEF